MPGTSEEERKDSYHRKGQRGHFKFPNKIQKQETRNHKEGEPSRKIQVCEHLVVVNHRFSSFFILFNSVWNLFCQQFSWAAICNTLGEQTTQELHIQGSSPSYKHPKDKNPAETEMWVSLIKFCHFAGFFFFSTRFIAFDISLFAVPGKLEDGRPSLLVKLLSSGSVPELGHSSSSEGEKEFASPEWDLPLPKNSIRKSWLPLACCF